MGQSKIKIQLIDSLSNEKVEYATVSLTKNGEKEVFLYGASDSLGIAEISGVPFGKYILNINQINYEPLSKFIEVKTKNQDFGQVLVKQKANSLSAITVIAAAIPIIIKKDTIEFSASAFHVGKGDALEQLIKKLPGMAIDKDGNITYNGKTINKILVDGEDFFSSDKKVLTSNLPAEIINKIKVIDKKSDQAIFSGIDDGQEETIMDVTIKDGFKKGLFGNVSAGAGTGGTKSGNLFAASLVDKTRFGVTFSTSNVSDLGVYSDGMGNYSIMGADGKMNSTSYGINGNTTLNKGKIKVNGSYSHNSSETESDSKSTRQTFLTDSSYIYKRDQTSGSKRISDNFSANVKWTPSKKFNISFMPGFNISKNTSSNRSKYSTDGETGVPINKGSSTFNSDGTSASFDGNLLLMYKFNKPRRTFSVNTTFSFSNGDNNGYNTSSTTKFNGNSESFDSLRQKNITASNGQNISMRASYTEPLIKNFILEIAYGLRYGNNVSDKNTYNWNNNTEKYDLKDETYSDNYKNISLNQNYNINLKKVEKNYNYQFGFSLQPSRTQSEGSKRDITNNVTNYSPSFSLMYILSKSSFLRINYRGISSQPSIDQMQPVPDNTNPLYIRIGNPDLIPSFRNNMELGFNRKGENPNSQILDLSVSASYNTKIISNISAYGKGGVQYAAPINTDPTYNCSARIGLFLPMFSNKIFTSLTSSVNYNNNLSYTANIAIDPQVKNEDLSIADFTNIKKNTTNNLFYRAGFSVSSLNIKTINFSLGNEIAYRNTWYSISSRKNADMWNYNLSAELSLNLHNGIVFSPNCYFSVSNGYGDEKDKPITKLNCEISKSFSKSNFFIRLKMYDILNQARGVNRTTNENFIEDREYTIQKRYVMLSITYKFGKFPKIDANFDEDNVFINGGNTFINGGNVVIMR